MWCKILIFAPRQLNTDMERITIFVRTTKRSTDEIRVRFRLRDGRDVDLYHKSDIRTTPATLNKFNPEGTVKSKVTDIDPDIVDAITDEITAMRRAYRKMIADGAPIDGETFEAAVRRQLNPSEVDAADRVTFLQRFHRYMEDAKRDGVFGDSRYEKYKIVYGKLSRFLTIVGRRDILPQQFDDEMLLQFRVFMFDEFTYVDSWRGLYVTLAGHNIPTKRLSTNTVATNLKILQTFFYDLENKEEITRSPFRRLGKDRKKTVMREAYDDPVFLREDEFIKVLETEVPEPLRTTKGAFLVQCAFGCRISDFKVLSMDNIAVSPDGFPYIHYLPQKTRDTQSDHREVETPIVRFAFDILKRTQFDFPVLRYATGENGYNAKIKRLLKYCEINRPVAVYNEEKKVNEYKPLWEVGSSKLCRKTHVDMLNKVQINKYAAGLHRVGSTAVDRYTKIELRDRFTLLCVAFDQEPYTVDDDLNVIE